MFTQRWMAKAADEKKTARAASPVRVQVPPSGSICEKIPMQIPLSPDALKIL